MTDYIDFVLHFHKHIYIYIRGRLKNNGQFCYTFKCKIGHYFLNIQKSKFQA